MRYFASLKATTVSSYNSFGYLGYFQFWKIWGEYILQSGVSRQVAYAIVTKAHWALN